MKEGNGKNAKKSNGVHGVDYASTLDIDLKAPTLPDPKAAKTKPQPTPNNTEQKNGNPPRQLGGKAMARARAADKARARAKEAKQRKVVRKGQKSTRRVAAKAATKARKVEANPPAKGQARSSGRSQRKGDLEAAPWRQSTTSLG